MKILGKNILLKPVPTAETSKGGIFLPDSSRQMTKEGIVAAIGAGITEAREYQKGSRVFVEMYQAKPYHIKGVDYVLVEQQHICGVMIGEDFHPVGDRIMLQQLPSHKSAIIRPSAYEADHDAPLHCKVIAVGSGVKTKSGKLVPFDVKVGQIVIIMPTSGRDVEAAEDIYKLVTQKFILGIIE